LKQYSKKSKIIALEIKGKRIGAAVFCAHKTENRIVSEFKKIRPGECGSDRFA
jgi:hypothetical protein